MKIEPATLAEKCDGRDIESRFNTQLELDRCFKISFDSIIKINTWNPPNESQLLVVFEKLDRLDVEESGLIQLVKAGIKKSCLVNFI